MFAQAQVDAKAADGGSVIAEIVHGFFLVAEGDVCAHLHKLLDQLFVADTRADEGHLFAADELGQLLLFFLHKTDPP